MTAASELLGYLRDVDVSFGAERATQESLEVLFEEYTNPHPLRSQGKVDNCIGLFIVGLRFDNRLFQHGLNRHLVIEQQLQGGQDLGLKQKRGDGVALVDGRIELVGVRSDPDKMLRRVEGEGGRFRVDEAAGVVNDTGVESNGGGEVNFDPEIYKDFIEYLAG